MSQPPWEGPPAPPAGWGPPPSPQQPGGWSQDPYQGPGYGHYAYGQQYPHSAYPEPPAFPPSPRKRNGGLIAGIVGSIGILVAAGVSVAALNHADDKPSTGPAVAAPIGTPSSGSSMSFPNNAYPSDGSGSSSSSGGSDSHSRSPAPSSGSSAADGTSALDRAATDITPFTSAALVATTFTDAKNVTYTLQTAGPQPCSKAGDHAVVAIVTSSGCTHFMAASWIDKSGRVLVSAMIFPYPDAATATSIENQLGDIAHTGDYSQWCPPAGKPYATLCSRLADSSASREGKFGSYHRYLLVTTAVYTDLRDDDSQDDWLSAAADGAFQNTLPDS